MLLLHIAFAREKNYFYLLIFGFRGVSPRGIIRKYRKGIIVDFLIFYLHTVAF
jgi:hypothetical protein